jgi:hypothetical protein
MPVAPIKVHQQIVAGDDYLEFYDRALTWHSTMWPDLSGSTLSMVVGQTRTVDISGVLPVTWTAPATPTDSKGVQTVTLELTSAETGIVPAGEFTYLLTAIFPDLTRVTIAQGKLTVWAAPGIAGIFPPVVPA